MKKVFIIAIIVGLSSFLAKAQDNDNGYLEVIQDSRIDSLVVMHKQINTLMQNNINNDGVDGYRIQIFFDSGNNSQAKATEVLEGFIESHPEVPAYISFKEPYYRVRIGDYRTKLEALGFLQKIIGAYPNAWVIKDKIHFPKIESNEITNE